MIVRLKHEQHGYTHVYDPNALEFHKSQGWRECDDTVSRIHKAADAALNDADARKRLSDEFHRKFGKKPHHKLSIDKLREAVKE